MQHVGGSLLGAQGDALEAERRLGDHAVRDAGVLLLDQAALEPGELRYLLADPLKALDHRLSELLRHLDVPAVNLDPHPCLLRRVDPRNATPETLSGQAVSGASFMSRLRER